MYLVTGSNLFDQWLTNGDKFESFMNVFLHTNSHNITDVSRAKLICTSWAYNILQIDRIFLISGSWRGQEKQLKTLLLPDTCTENSHLLVACSDYNVIVVDVTARISWILDLKTEVYKKVAFNEVIDKNIELSNDKIIKVRATNTSCLYLTSQGNVYFGLLPSHLFISQCMGKIRDIQCGYEHFMLLTDCGRVYTWGNGRLLQLGHGDLINLETPKEVEALAGIKIKKIRAGGWHSLALSEEEDVYAWGWNDTGQLGIKTKFHKDFNKKLKELKHDYSIPNIVQFYDEDEKELIMNVKDIACGSRHSVILLEDNSIWTAGNNKYGQLGFHTEECSKLDQFTMCYVSDDNIKLKCGPWNTIIDV